MAKAKSKSVVKSTAGAVLPSSFYDISGTGFEETDKDAFAIPFLRILQTNSPQVNEDEDSYVKGAKAGMFLDNVSMMLFGKSVDVIPVHYTRSFIEWLPDRGGFIKDHGPDTAIMAHAVQDETRKFILPNGNIIADTRNHFVIVVASDRFYPLIFPLSSSGIKHSRKWMSVMRALTLPNGSAAPMFSSVYNLGTVLNKNDDGTWYQIGDKNSALIKRVDWISASQLDAVKGFRELILSGKAQVNYDILEDDKEEVAC